MPILAHEILNADVRVGSKCELARFPRQVRSSPNVRRSPMSQTALKELAEIGRLLLVEICAMPKVVELVLHTPTDVLCPRSQFAEAFDVGASLGERHAQYAVH